MGTVKLKIKTSLSYLFVQIWKSSVFLIFICRKQNSEIYFKKTTFYDYRGGEFRTDYGKLAELRSILLALKATASPSTRPSIMNKPCMAKANGVVWNYDSQKNPIILNCIKAPYDENSTFS